jgi:hypothetical protein
MAHSRHGALVTPITVRDLERGGHARRMAVLRDRSAHGSGLIDAVEVSDSDPLMILYDAGGQQIAFNDDANGSLEQPAYAAVRCRDAIFWRCGSIPMPATA